ncbi:MAG: hypothetical protein AB7V46_08655 [Thermomicrobiales bacterium]
MTTEASDACVRDGEWIELPVSYVDPARVSCDLCGRPIARKFWREVIEGRDLRFCEPGHAELYESYWLPTYGDLVRRS